MDEVQEVARTLKNPSEARNLVTDIEGFISNIERHIDELESRHGAKEQVRNKRESLLSIYPVIWASTASIQSSIKAEGNWIELMQCDLKSRFEQFPHALERNSKGNYRIVNAPSDKGMETAQSISR